MKRNFDTAGYMLRLLAKLIDLNIVFIPVFLVFKYFSVVRTSYAFFNTILVLFMLLSLFAYINLIYITFFTHKFGGTVGKLILGLRVVDNQNKYLSIDESFFRCSVGYFVSALFFGLGYFWIIKDDKNQAWHDKVTGSYVIKKNVSSISIVLSVVLLLFFLVFYSISFYLIYKSFLENLNFILMDLKLKVDNIEYQILSIYQGK